MSARILQFPTLEDKQQRACAHGSHCYHARQGEPEMERCCHCGHWTCPEDYVPINFREVPRESLDGYKPGTVGYMVYQALPS
jgi:hypothetical protein